MKDGVHNAYGILCTENLYERIAIFILRHKREVFTMMAALLSIMFAMIYLLSR